MPLVASIKLNSPYPGPYAGKSGRGCSVRRRWRNSEVRVCDVTTLIGQCNIRVYERRYRSADAHQNFPRHFNPRW